MGRTANSVLIVVLAGLLFLILTEGLNRDVNGPAGALLLPFVVVLARRYPAAAIAAVLLVTGYAGTLTALTPVQVRFTVDLLLLSMWLGVVWSYAGRRQRPLWLWPALLAPFLYIALSALQALTGTSVSDSLESFRLSVWPMLALFLVAVMPLSDKERDQLPKALLIVASAVCAYAVYRWFVGPAPEEEALARSTHPLVSEQDEVRFFGPAPDAESLALWCALVLPTGLAMCLGWRGRWRLFAALVTTALAFCLIATEIRTGAVAAVAGVVLTLVLFQLARAYPGGLRVAAVITTLLTLAAVGIGAFALSVGQSQERVDRFERILNPSEDRAFSSREARWEDTWPKVGEEPLGHGLGTVGIVARSGPFRPETVPFVDSSYVKVAFEQGFLVMVLFAGSLCVLLASLAHRAITTLEPRKAVPAIGACGSLLTVLVFFFGGEYVEHTQIAVAWLIIGIGVSQFTSPRLDGPSAAARPG